MFLLYLQEVHILNQFAEDFYGERLNIVVLQYLRPERDFDSLGKQFFSYLAYVLSMYASILESLLF